MEEEGLTGQRRGRKRSRSVSSDDSTSSERSREKKTTTNGSLKIEASEDRGVYGRRIPYFGENSINNILKVVSLQSFSNPRLSLLNEGERSEVPDQKTVKTTESDSQSDSSEELTRKDRSSPSSEDTVPPTGHSHIIFASKAREKREDLTNSNMMSEIVNGKDRRYWEKRQRNNASAKRSRDARRVRELETQIRAEYLEDENYRVKIENEVLREENARLLKTIERLKKNASSSVKEICEWTLEIASILYPPSYKRKKGLKTLFNLSYPLVLKLFVLLFYHELHNRHISYCLGGVTQHTFPPSWIMHDCFCSIQVSMKSTESWTGGRVLLLNRGALSLYSHHLAIFR